MKTRLLIIVLTTIALIILLLVVFILPKVNNKSALSETTPTPTPSQNEEIKIDTGFTTDSASAEQEQKSFAVGNLISKLPVKGGNFSFYYSFSTNKFTVYIDPAHKELADSQFEAFLEENSVQKGWIGNLVTETKDVIPAP